MSRPLLRASLLLASALLLPACAGPGSRSDRPAPTRVAVSELAPTQTYAIRFGSALAGYLVEVLPVAAGAPDSRAYEPGTALIQDLDHTLLGYISPRATTYRFDADGQPHTVAFGTSRDSSITNFFRQIDAPTLTPVDG